MLADNLCYNISSHICTATPAIGNPTTAKKMPVEQEAGSEKDSS